MSRAVFLCMLALVAACDGRGRDAMDDRPATHEYSEQRDSLRMRDGTWLAVTMWVPTPRTEGEHFPALLEMIPYRKDDDFYARDMPLYDWFARRGFLMAKVDVRGTGGSSGPVPSREYSEEELDDAVQVIAALAADPRSNGRVGMWGISWGGFNAIQVALRHPPALGAILAVHASDDLFHDDVRYIDGVLHVDRYALQIDHGNGLPRTPDYALDSAYFADRFDQRPWILGYLEQQQDGDFWRANALRYRREDLRVPAYLIGGLLDGYRDTPIRALADQQARIRAGAADSTVEVSPLKVEMGPWTHAWPDNGTPGPNYEWRVRAAQWWDHWLRDRRSDLMKEPPLLVYQRAAHAPDTELATTPGHWRFEEWPPFRGTVRTLPFSTQRPDAWGALEYVPSVGAAAGEWWGEPTSDMAPDDERSITVDLDPDQRPLSILGIPRVRLVVRHGAPLAHWVARLESVDPEGRSSLITGGAINVTQRDNAAAPELAVVDATDTLTFDLHFATWTLPAGHRLRVAISNAQFPMLWPTPYRMTNALDLAASHLELPVVPSEGGYDPPRLPESQPRAQRRDVQWLADSSEGPVVTRDRATGRVSVRWSTLGDRTQKGTRIIEREEETYSVRDDDPAGATFAGFKSHRFAFGARVVEVRTRISITGARSHLDVTFTRDLTENGRLVRHREWRERIPRRWH